MSPAGNCFAFQDALVDQPTAKTRCGQLARNGRLAKITNMIDSNFVLDMCTDSNKACWIGLQKQAYPLSACTVSNPSQCSGDATCKCAYKWSDGTALTWTHWALDRPAFTSPLCVRMVSKINGTDTLGWYDDHCSNTRRYICQGALSYSVILMILSVWNARLL